jgi:carboxypeptidase T
LSELKNYKNYEKKVFWQFFIYLLLLIVLLLIIIMKKNLTYLIVFFLAVSSFAQSEKYSRIKIYLEPETLNKLGQLGIPPEGGFHRNLYLTTEVRSDLLPVLSAEGVVYEVIFDDVSSYYEYQNLSPDKDLRTSFCDPVFNYETPSNFTLGSMGGYLTLSEIYEQLDSMAALYPTIISPRQTISTFTTHDGHSLYYAKISDNPQVNENEPKVFYQALVHAREPMGMQQLIFFMWYLLENYATNPEIQYLLNNAELFFVPCANPDGYEFNRINNPNGGGMWRKNRRVSGGNQFGVDLNRNFGHMWGYNNTGSSPDPSTDTYRGPSAFSEPESQAVKWLCETYEPLLMLDYHTYSDVLLTPWGYENIKCPDSTLYDVYSSFLTSENKFPYGTPMETIGYNANGGSFDWYYGEQTTKNKIIGWGPEAGDPADGFWPAQNKIEDIAKHYVAMNMYAARFALKYAEAIDKTDRYISVLSSQFVYDIQRLGMDSTGTFTVSILPLLNVSTTGGQKQYAGLDLLEVFTDSIEINLLPGIMPGDEISFLMQVNNGHYTKSDTIRKVFGTPVAVFADDCSGTAAWTGPWGISTSRYVSQPSSITDSPSGSYQNNSTTMMTTLNPVDLTVALDARLSFFASWDIEKGYDYVQLQIAENNTSTWMPLCGKFTRTGTVNQAPGQPIYDGTMLNWIHEEINLNEWLGKEVKFRFMLISDWWVNADGFYFDDFIVEAIIDTTTSVQNESLLRLMAFPNPAQEVIYFSGIQGNDLLISIYNSNGVLVLKEKYTHQPINISWLPNGLYYSVISDSHATGRATFMIQR